LLEIDGVVKDSIIGVFAHITVLDATVPGHVTAFPSTQNRPDSSVVNFANGEISSTGIFIATPFLAALREREPAMQALRKRVAARGGASASSISQSTTTSNSDERSLTAANDDRPRGPRNQPKRKRKHRR
jgi:hypothetical protein